MTMRTSAIASPRFRRVSRSIIAVFRGAAHDWRAYALIALITLCSSLPGITQIPVMDVDEARFAQATRQMLETGDFVRIRLQEAERNRKPVGVHWLQAASTAIFEPIAGGQNSIWTYRLPSVLGALIAAFATLWAGRVLLGPQTALIGASLLGAGLTLGFEGMTAKTDALMVGFTTLAIAALAHLRAADTGFAQPHSSNRIRAIGMLFWGALGCAILIKGPIPLTIALLTLATLAVWDRRAAWMAPLGWWPGPLLCVGIVLPWGIAIGLATDWRFYTDALGQDFVPKLAGQDHAHGGIFGYHFLLMPVLMFPATFAFPAVARLLTQRDSTPAEASAFRFLLAWAGPALLMFELSPSKLLHYALPTYPAVALLCAAGLVAALTRRWRWTLALGLAAFGLAGAALTVALGFGLAELNVSASDAIKSIALCGAIVLCGVIALSLLRTVNTITAVAVMSGLLLSVALRGAIIPQIMDLQTSARASQSLARVQNVGALWIVGYDEPSIVFLTRTDAILATAVDAGQGVAAGDAAIIERAHVREFSQILARRRLQFAPNGAPIEGLSMSSNDQVDLFVGEIRAGTE
jgi:4-amino-4-deoxy-L-arabinose transferase-like glycosyltransferase